MTKYLFFTLMFSSVLLHTSQPSSTQEPQKTRLEGLQAWASSEGKTIRDQPIAQFLSTLKQPDPK